MNVKWATWIVMTSLMVLGCRTANSTPSRALAFDPSRDVYTHESSGFSFPATVDRFERHDGIQFHDEAGNDVSVPYNLDYNPDTQEAKAIGTVYVYPAPRVYSVSPMSGAGVRRALEWASDSQYEQSKRAIIESYGARVIFEGQPTTHRSLLGPNGRMGVFEWEALNGENVVSHLYVFTHRGWFVKYRFTYPGKFRPVVEPQVDTFMRTFRWP